MWPALRAIAVALACGLPACAAGQPAAQRFAPCAECHGAQGISTRPATPSLAGQPAFFVIAQLFLFRDGRRDNAEMIAAAKGLTNDDLRAFGDYVAKLAPPAPPAQAPDPARYARGVALARAHRCGTCHSADFAGLDQTPRLACQREDYLLKALRDFKQGRRIGYGNAAMAETVVGLNDADLADLAHFLAHFSASRAPR